MGRKKAVVVISNWKGITTMRSKPDKVNQTGNTVQAGRFFGMASSRCAIIRKLLNSLLPEPANRAVIYRFQHAFYQWLRSGALNESMPADDISFFKGLSFNEKNELSRFLKFTVKAGRLASGQLVLNLPAIDPVQQIKSPEGTTSINIYIGVASLELDNVTAQDYWQGQLTIQNIPDLLPAQKITLPVDPGTDKLLIVVIALQYDKEFSAHHLADRLPWKPAGIVGSFYN